MRDTLLVMSIFTVSNLLASPAVYRMEEAT